MKKALVFFIVGFVFFGSCSAQNANAQSSNDAQRIVGTWKAVDSDGETRIFTFSADGTYTYSSGYTGRMSTPSNGNYFVNGTILFTHSSGFGASPTNFYISPNGRILVYGSTWYEKQ